MGQYYKIVNPDKRQYLDPHKFGSGLKLLEFAGSRHGPLEALGILLAHANGRGGGDLAIYTNEKSITDDERALIGSWAGDRIVVAGDYDDPWLWVPEDLKGKEYTVETYDYSNSNKKISYIIPFGKRHKDYRDLKSELIDSDETLYNAAEYFFEDISDKIIAVVAKAEASYGHPWATFEKNDDGWRNLCEDGVLPKTEPKKPIAGKRTYNTYKKNAITEEESVLNNLLSYVKGCENPVKAFNLISAAVKAQLESRNN